MPLFACVGAKGLNGILYSMILCKHNPPHGTKRKFTDQEPNGDFTEPLNTVAVPLRQLDAAVTFRQL